MVREITACRICANTQLVEILQLGVQSLTGVFPRDPSEPITAGPVELVKCAGVAGCGLVQLRQSYEPHEMYGQNYGYRSGLNASMVNHLRGVVEAACKRVDPAPSDLAIDIGSNDSTLLRGYPSSLRLIGVDPTGAKFRGYYPPHVELVPDFFSARALAPVLRGAKAKIVTSIAMVYDLEEPLSFFAEVREVLEDDGIWVFEQSYLPAMLQATAYDTVCHEHLEYYSLYQILYMTERVGLKVLDVELNATNGGSFCVTVAKRESRLEADGGKIESLLREEEAMGLSGLKPYEEFRERVFAHRDALVRLLVEMSDKNELVLGYGASTKGNVILQFCGVTPEILPAIAEVNEDKFGRLTPGTHIPIVSEAKAKARSPRALLVLPWHFRDNILLRESAYLGSGGKLIFPLPTIEIVG